MKHPEKGAGASQLVHVGHGSVVGLEGVVRVRVPFENAAVNAAIVSVLPTLDAATVHVRRENELTHIIRTVCVCHDCILRGSAR